MALILYGNGVTEMRGSSGGNTWSRNRFGAYMRNRTPPVNPQSSRQQAIRNIFSDMAEQWRSVLTEAQRVAWNLYGSSIIMKNKLGQDINLSGFNMFLRSNVARQQCGIAVVAAGPTIFTLPDTDGSFSVSISEATQLISVTFDDTRAWCDEDNAFLSILMSQPRSEGRNFIQGPFRFADSIDGDSVTPPTSPATIAVPFVVEELHKVTVMGRIGRADGRLSELFQDTVSVAA